MRDYLIAAVCAALLTAAGTCAAPPVVPLPVSPATPAPEMRGASQPMPGGPAPTAVYVFDNQQPAETMPTAEVTP